MAQNGNRILWALVIVLILSNFAWTTYIAQQFSQVAEKIDIRLRVVETEHAITRNEQLARTQYFNELRELMLDLRTQMEASRRR